MTEDKFKNSMIDFCKNMEGKTISTVNAVENLHFIQESKKLAQTYEWLYHCTTASALKSILRNKEFWLSNLQLVNDKEEAKRINVPEYEKEYYVCCFSYNSEIPKEHWEEYGNMENGVLIAVKQKWFLRNAIFMCGTNQKCTDDFFCIMKNQDSALEYKIERQKDQYLTNPFYINSYGFYQVIYDDKLKKNIHGGAEIEVDGFKIPGRSLSPEVAGIIKSTHGMCQRNGKEPYEKDWTTEKEVRLKVGIQQFDINVNGNEVHDGMIMQSAFFPKIAVSISEEAFDEIKIKFSPKFENKDEFLNELREIMPHSKFEII